MVFGQLPKQEKIQYTICSHSECPECEQVAWQCVSAVHLEKISLGRDSIYSPIICCYHEFQHFAI